MSGKSWTKQELRKLRNGAMSLPGRSPRAIWKMRIRLNISKKKRDWSAKEIEQLKQGLPIKGRSSTAVECKRQKLRILVRPRWTDEQQEHIFDQKVDRVIGTNIGRSHRAVQHKRRRMAVDKKKTWQMILEKLKEKSKPYRCTDCGLGPWGIKATTWNSQAYLCGPCALKRAWKWLMVGGHVHVPISHKPLTHWQCPELCYNSPYARYTPLGKKKMRAALHGTGTLSLEQQIEIENKEAVRAR